MSTPDSTLAHASPDALPPSSIDHNQSSARNTDKDLPLSGSRVTSPPPPPSHYQSFADIARTNKAASSNQQHSPNNHESDANHIYTNNSNNNNNNDIYHRIYQPSSSLSSSLSSPSPDPIAMQTALYGMATQMRSMLDHFDNVLHTFHSNYLPSSSSTTTSLLSCQQRQQQHVRHQQQDNAPTSSRPTPIRPSMPPLMMNDNNTMSSFTQNSTLSHGNPLSPCDPTSGSSPFSAALRNPSLLNPTGHVLSPDDAGNSNIYDPVVPIFLETDRPITHLADNMGQNLSYKHHHRHHHHHHSLHNDNKNIDPSHIQHIGSPAEPSVEALRLGMISPESSSSSSSLLDDDIHPDYGDVEDDVVLMPPQSPSSSSSSVSSSSSRQQRGEKEEVASQRHHQSKHDQIEAKKRQIIKLQYELSLLQSTNNNTDSKTSSIVSSSSSVDKKSHSKTVYRGDHDDDSNSNHLHPNHHNLFNLPSQSPSESPTSSHAHPNGGNGGGLQQSYPDKDNMLYLAHHAISLSLPGGYGSRHNLQSMMSNDSITPLFEATKQQQQHQRQNNPGGHDENDGMTRPTSLSLSAVPRTSVIGDNQDGSRSTSHLVSRLDPGQTQAQPQHRNNKQSSQSAQLSFHDEDDFFTLVSNNHPSQQVNQIGYPSQQQPLPPSSSLPSLPSSAPQQQRIPDCLPLTLARPQYIPAPNAGQSQLPLPTTTFPIMSPHGITSPHTTLTSSHFKPNPPLVPVSGLGSGLGQSLLASQLHNHNNNNNNNNTANNTNNNNHTNQYNADDTFDRVEPILSSLRLATPASDLVPTPTPTPAPASTAATDTSKPSSNVTSPIQTPSNTLQQINSTLTQTVNNNNTSNITQQQQQPISQSQLLPHKRVSAATMYPAPPPPPPPQSSSFHDQGWNKIRIGIDVGGTLAKLCYFSPHVPLEHELGIKSKLDQYLGAAGRFGSVSGRRSKELEISLPNISGTIHFVKFDTTRIASFFELVMQYGLGHVAIYATGGGAHKYQSQFIYLTHYLDRQQDALEKQQYEQQQQHQSSLSTSQQQIHQQQQQQHQQHQVPHSQSQSQQQHSHPPATTTSTYEVVDEMAALVRGVGFLLTHSAQECFSYKRYLFHEELELYPRNPPSYPFLLVNIGSGVSILRVDNEKQYIRVGGSSLGGGTFYGLCRALTGCHSFAEALQLAHKGKGSKVDLLVNDIYGRDYTVLGLSGDTIAASFGKLVKANFDHDITHSNGHNTGNNYNNTSSSSSAGNSSSSSSSFQNVSREDLAKSALVMITNNICSLAHLYARQVLKVPSVVFVGNFLRNNVLAMRMLSYALAYWSSNTIEAIFLKHEGYFGAIGCVLPQDIPISAPLVPAPPPAPPTQPAPMATPAAAKAVPLAQQPDQSSQQSSPSPPLADTSTNITPDTTAPTTTTL